MDGLTVQYMSEALARCSSGVKAVLLDQEKVRVYIHILRTIYTFRYILYIHTIYTYNSYTLCIQCVSGIGN